MADAQIYQKTAGAPTPEKMVILNVRAYEIHPFIAPNWLDLRVGFFLSLTSEAGLDDPAALAETIPDMGQGLPTEEHYFIGVSHQAPSVFIGFTNATGPDPTNYKGDSMLISSGAGLAAGTDFWRPKNSDNDRYAAGIFEAGHQRGVTPLGLQQHFPQTPATAGGYAVMLGLQLLRDNPNSLTIRANIKSDANSADMLYSNTPTLEVLKAALQTWPPSQQLGPVTLSAAPNNLFFYWPFRQSRLRIHSYGLLRAK